MVQPGIEEVDLGATINWLDMLHPTSGAISIGHALPTHYVDSRMEPSLDALVSLAAIVAVNPVSQWAKSRSISKEVTRLIARGARLRQTFEMFFLKPDDEDIPLAPDGRTANLGKSLSEMLLLNPCLTEEIQQQLVRLLSTYKDAFSVHGKIAKVGNFWATIPMEGKLPPPQPLRLMSNLKKDIVAETIEDYGRWDVIEASTSPTCSAIVLVWQNRKWRFCVDFRVLNKIIVGDACPMLRSDYVFAAMAGKQFFSILDARKGYHQVEIDSADRHKTAFISHRGLYQFKRMPFGLKNAPAIFPRLIDEVVGTLRWNAVLVYIDNMVIYNDTCIDHLMHLETLLQSAVKFGLKFAVDKCRFGFHDIRLLGHGLSRYGLHTLEDKVRAIMEL